MSWSKYPKLYRSEWEQVPELKDWLTGGEDGAKCKVCNTALRPQLADLKRHAETQKHQTQVQAKRFQPSILTFRPTADHPSVKKKRLELRIALQSACCTTFRSVDSLGSILEDELGKDKFKMHRTKCTALVRKVLGPHFEQELKADIQKTPFSLLIDESTDVAVSKILGVSIRYYSKSHQKIISTFLSVIEVQRADAEALESEIRFIMVSQEISFGCSLNFFDSYTLRLKPNEPF